MTPRETVNQGAKMRRAFMLGFRLLIFLAFVGATLFGGDALVRKVMQTSPALFLASILTSRRVPTDLVFGAISGAIFIACAFRRRFFCRRVCPLGACVDVAAYARRRLFKRPALRFGATRVLRPFPILALVWLAALLVPLLNRNVSIPFDLTPLAFDPTSLLASWLRGDALGVSLAFFVGCFLVASYAWRFQVCPCGLFQDLLFLPTAIVQRIRKRLRKKALDKAPNEVEKERESSTTRRNFLLGGATCAVVALFWSFAKRAASNARNVVFRPPGALPSPQFEALCSQCGQCLRACPTRILTTATPQFASSLPLASTTRGTPIVLFERGDGYCEKDCVACADACPTGAIAPITIPTKPSYPIATAVFRLDYCLLYYQQECSICRRECPYDAIDFVWSDEEYASLPTIREEACVGCGRCVVRCPGAGDFVDEEEKHVKALSLKPRDV